jgi:hypothetical protein
MNEKKNAYRILLGRPDENISIGICGRIILKCNLEWYNWIGFPCLIAEGN